MSAQEKIREEGEVSLEISSEPAFVRDCGTWAQSACSGLPFYKEKEGKRYCVLHYPGKDKSEEFKIAMQQKLKAEDFDFRGVWFPDEVSFRKFRFSKSAVFSGATFTEEADFTSATFTEVADFISTTFTKGAGFNHATFTKGAYFYSATFTKGAYFYSATFTKGAGFSHATFTEEAVFNFTAFTEEASFIGVTFTKEAHFIGVTCTEEAKFSLATFTEAVYFSLTTFTQEADFNNATFTKEAHFNRAAFTEEADFNHVTFTEEADFIQTFFNKKAGFGYAIFKDYLSFADNFEDSSSLDLQFARIEKPDRVSFHTLKLRPHWFINIDARKFEFANVEWMPEGFEIKKELEAMESKKIGSPHRMLSIACRHLAVNAEESHRYEEASKFRYMSMETRRMEPGRRFAFLSLHWWYWLASGYGERIRRAFLMLGAIWLLFALLYTQVGFTRSLPSVAGADPVIDVVGEPLSFRRSFTYSLGVMSLQKPEPRPLTNTAHALVTLETILGPVQAALLALAIRRKFMR